MAPSGLEDSQCRERESSEDDLYSDELTLRELSATNSKRRRLSKYEKELSRRSVKLDEGIGSALHDYLVEKILVRLPFKSLFQVPSLSKSSRLRFRSDLFQSEVRSLSAASWKAYAPVCMNRKMDLVGYESSSQRWHVLPNHSYIQHDVVETWLRAGAGSLLCWTDPQGCGAKVYHVNVTNPLTRTWRRLPSRPNMEYPHSVHVVCEGTQAYKVILATRGPIICVQIFDSTTGSWTLNTHNTLNLYSDLDDSAKGIAFIDGVLYLMFHRMYRLISFNVEEKIWTEILLLPKASDGDHQFHQLMTFCDVRVANICFCGSNVMLVMAHIDKFHDVVNDNESDDWQDHSVWQTISVFELDLDRGLAVEVSRAPNEMANGTLVCSAAGYGDCICIGSTSPIVYNVDTREWHWVNSATDMLEISFPDYMYDWLWTSITYQPGLNPFLEV